MNKTYLLSRMLVVLFFSLSFTANAQVWIEDFDGSNATNPFSMTTCDASPSRDYLGIVCNNGAGCTNEINSDYIYNNASGQYFGVRDMDNVCGGSLSETISATGIDISSCSAATTYVCFDLAESAPNNGRELNSSDGTEDTWDGNQSNTATNGFVTFTASVDGGSTFSIASFAAFGNNNTGPGADTNCDGTADGVALTDAFQTFCYQLAMNGNALNLDISVGGFNSDGDDVAIDNIAVHCGTPPSGTILDSCTPFMPSNLLFLENFDGSNMTNPFSMTGCDASPSRDYLGIVCNNGAGCTNEINSDYIYNNASGQYFAARDMDNVCGGSLNETITSTGIDISGCSGAGRVFLCFDIAESSPNNGRELNSSDGSEDTWDGNQGNPASNGFVTFSAAVDGGAAFPVASFAAFGNNNTGPGVDADCDGTAEGAALSDAFTTFCFEVALTGNTLDLDLNLGGFNTDGDDVAIDNISVYCAEDVAILPAALTASCTAPPMAAVPTLGEWALFILFLLVLNLGAVFIFATQNSLSMANGNETVSMSSMFRSLPFDNTNFKRAMKHAFGVALVGFVLIFIGWGEIVGADLIGMALSIPLVAYFIHLFFTKE